MTLSDCTIDKVYEIALITNTKVKARFCHTQTVRGAKKYWFDVLGTKHVLARCDFDERVVVGVKEVAAGRWGR